MLAFVATFFHFLLVAQNTTYSNLHGLGDFPIPITQTLPVGSIAGSANASGGSAGYSIPIALPPGTNGVVPSVSINYNSMGGRSNVGYGWSIGGLSAITRTGKSIINNGAISEVKLTNEDRFVLDGARLFTKSGIYGANAATYGTESENFATITSYKTFGVDPQWFKVEAKDGSIMEYGNSTNSQFTHYVTGTNGVALESYISMWRLNKITYPDGNYVTFSYAPSPISDRDPRIDEINYTGNVAAGVTPYNKIKFNYKIRSDVSTMYENGFPIESKFLLDNITITTENSVVFKKYFFNYGYEPGTGTVVVNSYLKEVTEEGSDATTLNKTIFKYGNGSPQFSAGTTSIPTYTNTDLTTGDFNADGYSDIVSCKQSTIQSNGLTYHSELKLFLKDPTQNTAYTPASTIVDLTSGVFAGSSTVTRPRDLITGDYTGDGIDDLLLANTTFLSNTTTIQKVFILPGDPASTSGFATPIEKLTPTLYPIVNVTKQYLLPGDFNGDGKNDLILMSGKNTATIPEYIVTMSLGTSVNFSMVTTSTSVTYDIPLKDWANVDQVKVLDFNGDGKTDILLSKQYNTEIFTFDGFQARRIYSGSSMASYLMFIGDFNGDGKSDILSRTNYTSGTNTWSKLISTGTSFITTPFTWIFAIPTINSAYVGDRLFLADFNGDGRSDIYFGYNYYDFGSSAKSKMEVYNSTGDGFQIDRYEHTNSFSTNNNVLVGDANGDGKADIVNFTFGINSFDVGYIKKETKELLLHKVTNGQNHSTEWTYKRMTESGGTYTRGAITAHPVNNIQKPINLVSEMKMQDGTSATNTSSMLYTYEEAKLHKEGRGLMGFKKTSVTNVAMGIKTVAETDFNTTYYVAVPLKNSTYLVSNNSLLSETTLTNQFVQQNTGTTEKRFWMTTTQIVENQALEGRTLTTFLVFDTYGNVNTNTVNKNNEEITTTTATYVQAGTTIPAKPSRVTVKNKRGLAADYTVITDYQYNAIGQLTQKIDFWGSPMPAKAVTNTYAYNNRGNLTSTSVAAAGLTTRTTSSIYDTKGRYPETMTNTLGQNSTATYDPKWGSPLTQTDINGLVTSYLYDGYGRRTKTTLPTTVAIDETYTWDVGATTRHKHTITHAGKPDMITTFDMLDREVKKEVEGYKDGGTVTKWVTSTKIYDARGNVSQSTSPIKTGETPLTTTVTFDPYNRPITTSNVLTTTTFAYAYAAGKLITTVSNTSSNPVQTTSKKTDAVGRTIEATDNGGTLFYTYNSQGNPTEVKLGTTIMVTNAYDDYGRQTSMIDANAGTTTYDYDAFGQLMTQKSALHTTAAPQITTMTYDAIGRVTQKTAPEGTTLYEYHPTITTATATAAVPRAAQNQLKKLTGFTTNPDLQEFTYDNFGRVLTDIVTVGGIQEKTTYTYNLYGDVATTEYPSLFKVTAEYEAGTGYLKSLKNIKNAVTTTIFTAGATNGFGQSTSYTLGNGKTSATTYYNGIPTNYNTTGVQNLTMAWNYATGNLTSRQDAIKNLTESFTYDNLNRLTGSTIGATTMSMVYSANGNISSKTDAGVYVYGSAAPNALTKVTTPTTALPTLTQDIIYTPYFQPEKITEGINVLTYTYGHDQQRIKSELKVNGLVTTTRIYLSGCEKETTANTTRYIHYISAGPGLVAIVVTQAGAETYHYTYTDHLGSILTSTNSTGVIDADQNFDAWGRNRNTTNWTYASVQPNPTWLYRGYTGHEHLAEFRLINMNGRLYDPVVGRMLSVDNNVQSPDYSQNFNRYSYALNNPLKFTDPDGESVILLGIAIALALNTVKQYNANNESFKNWNWGQTIGAIVGGAVGGAVGNAVGGALALAHIGGISGGAILGAASGFTGTLSGNIVSTAINREDLTAKSLIWQPLLAALSGGVIGGVMGGLDAYGKNARLWDGRGKQVHSVFINDSGGTVNPKDNFDNYRPYENSQRLNETAGSVRGTPNTRSVNINNGGYEGGYNVSGRASIDPGESFFFNVDGVDYLNIQKSGLYDFKVPSGNHTFSWGVVGQSSRIVNTTLQQGVDVFGGSTFTKIQTNWRSWDGLFFFK
jgi:RHS repeat-associated protein